MMIRKSAIPNKNKSTTAARETTNFIAIANMVRYNSIANNVCMAGGLSKVKYALIQ